MSECGSRDGGGGNERPESCRREKAGDKYTKRPKRMLMDVWKQDTWGNRCK